MRLFKQASDIKLDWAPSPVELFFSHDDLREAMREEVRDVPFAGTTIPLVAAEHLVIRKAMLDRPKDWLDIEQILVGTDQLDLDVIESRLEEMDGGAKPRLLMLRQIATDLSLGDPFTRKGCGQLA